MKNLLICLIFLILLMPKAACAIGIVEVVGPKSGVKAWLVEDHNLPIMAMRFAFRGGSEQDPVDKQGLENLTVDLLTEGAGSYNAHSFQKQLADRSISLGFSAERDEIAGGLKCLTADRSKALDMLRLALTKPNFDEKDIERLRSHQMSMLRQQFSDPSWQARFALYSQIYANHPYSERHLGTVQTLSGITRDDIIEFDARHLARDNLIVAVAGDISSEDLEKALDTIFIELPSHAQLNQVAEVQEPTESQTILVKRDGTQTELMFAMPGPKREDKDWYAIDIANYILGGGGFSSRLMQDVRDKRGLTYEIDTDLAPSEHDGLIVGQTAVDNAKVPEALSAIHDTMAHFHDEGATAREISVAKDYLTGSKPLSLTSTDKIAQLMVAMQKDNLGSDYLDRYTDIIRRVSIKDVSKAIDKWFNPDKTTWVMVGKPENISANQIKEMTRQ